LVLLMPPDLHALKLHLSDQARQSARLGITQCASSKDLKLAQLFEPLPRGLIGGQPSFRFEPEV
jgi:hypothetical protein